MSKLNYINPSGRLLVTVNVGWTIENLFLAPFPFSYSTAYWNFFLLLTFFYKHLFVIYSSWIYVNHHNYKSVYFYRILNSIIVLHQISSNFLTGGISWWADPRTSIILVSKNVICLISHSDIWLIDRRMLMLSRKALLTVFTFLSENLLISIIIVIRHSLTATWMYIVI